MMRPWALLFMLIVMVVTVSSCAHNPTKHGDTEGVKQIREDYLKNYPEGRFNAHILKGEVIEGMGFIDVIASWGIPNLRRSPRGSQFEYWVYYERDKDAGMVTIFELVFRDEQLHAWNIDKNISGQGGMSTLETSTSEPDVGEVPPSSGGTLKKKH